MRILSKQQRVAISSALLDLSEANRRMVTTSQVLAKSHPDLAGKIAERTSSIQQEISIMDAAIRSVREMDANGRYIKVWYIKDREGVAGLFTDNVIAAKALDTHQLIMQDRRGAGELKSAEVPESDWLENKVTSKNIEAYS